MRYRPQDSLLVGLDPSTLQTMLTQAQTAYANLMAGGLAESLSYTSGDGTKSVTYTRANINLLANWIRELQAQLGLVRRPRRAMSVYF
jgi:hypothetical protein